MPEQLSLDFAARARTMDPATSWAAAREVTTNGVALHQREACLAAVVAAPGSTSAEVAVRACLDRYAAARRLPELRVAGCVRNGDVRRCRVTGRASLTWWPAEDTAP
jgi:hypothetical protein